MKTNRITYGIDLGTTNSSNSRMIDGKPVTVKSKLRRDIVPSCVAVSKSGNIVAGDKARSLLQRDFAAAFSTPGFSFNSFIEFKRQMGKDVKYISSILNRGFSPEELSAQVLMELKRNVYDDVVSAAVITVPAMFDNNQKDATMRAAALAGFDYAELIQEPLAASVAYGLTADKADKYWLVFDMGGGTFDVAVMRMKDGIVAPVDTTGCNSLGGKDIDAALIDGIIIPHLKARYAIDGILENRGDQFRSLWKYKVEEAKIALSSFDQVTLESDLDEDYGVDDNGCPIELDLVISRHLLNRVQRPVFQTAIDMTLSLLDRAGVNPSLIRDIVLVGGPTMSPLLRSMLSEAIPATIRNDVDPMTCVSQGAAIYGSTITIPDHIIDKSRNRAKVQLEVMVKGDSAQPVEFASVKLLGDKCDNLKSQWVLVDFVRNDGVCSTGTVKVDEAGDVVELPLKENSVNIFSLRCYDSNGNELQCEPSEVSIIHGSEGIGEAIMPLTLGIGVSDSDNDEVFKPIQGLQRGVRLPAHGVVRSLRTRREMYPADSRAEIRMSLYQKEEFDDMATRTILCSHLYDVTINGDDLPAILPMGSEVNIRLHADKSGRIDSFIVDIPYLDLEIDITDRVSSATKAEVPLAIATQEASSAIRKARIIDRQEYVHELSSIIRQYSSSRNREVKDALFDRLCRLSEMIDKEFNTDKVNRAIHRLRRLFNSYSLDVQKYGSSEHHRTLEADKRELDAILCNPDYNHISDFTDRIWLKDYKLAKMDYFISWIILWDKEFDSMGWRDPVRASQLINRAKLMIDADADAREMTPLIEELKSLLPDYQNPVNDILQG